MSSRSSPEEGGGSPAVLPELPILNPARAAAAAPAAARAAIRPRTARWRAWTLFGVNLLILAHIGWWLWRRSALAPVELAEAMSFSKEGVINAGLVLFAAAAAVTLIFGRFFCGWACHFVAIQDASRWLLAKMGLRPPTFRSRLLRWVPIAAFAYMFLLPMALRWWEGIPHPGVTRFEWTTSAFWRTFPGWGIGILTFVVCGFGAVWFFGAKGFCTYACPYGALFGAADAFAPGRIVVSDACQGCARCTAVCTSNVRVHQEVREFGMVVDPGCMKCMDCVSACPSQALSFGFAAPAALSKRRAPASPRPPPIPWALDLAMLAISGGSFFVLRDLYGAVPFLLAVGLGVASAWLFAKAWECLRAPQARFSAWVLKREGRLRLPGALLLLLASLWLAFLIHAGVVRARTLPRNADFERLRPWMEAVLTGGHPAVGGAPDPFRAVGVALERRVTAADAAGILPDARNDWALAWARLAQDDSAGFEQAMAEVLRLRPRFGEALMQRGLVRYWSGDLEGARADFLAIPWFDHRADEAEAFLADLAAQRS